MSRNETWSTFAVISLHRNESIVKGAPEKT